MVKLVKSVVGTNRALLGFIVQGKEREFGGFSDAMIEKALSIGEMAKEKFHNNQVMLQNGKLIERNNFKINELPMVVYDQSSGNYVPISNGIELIGRFVQDNENIGFRVKFSDGSEDNVRYKNVIMLCKWFKPCNFMIRSSSKGNQYICGKQGFPSINELPAKNMNKEAGEEVKKTKRMKSSAQPPISNFNGSLESGFDILDIYDFIRECNGAVIKLPSEEYVSASEDGVRDDGEFQSLGIGEVATPNPLYNATKINVNAPFKKVGVVPVNIGGYTNNIVTYVHRSKSIFLNGENYMKKFGIAVPVDKEAALLKSLGGSLGISKITDNSVINPLSQVINVKSLSFFTVDTSKIDLISEKKRDASIMSAAQIAELCKKRYNCKLISKALGPKGGVMKELAGTLSKSDIAEATNRNLFGIFATMNSQALSAIEAAGIDIYSGAYTVAGSTITKKPSSGDGEVQVEIEYVLPGYDDGKVTGKAVLDAAMNNDTNKVPNAVLDVVQSVLAIQDLKERYKKAKEVYDQNELAEISKKFWMHNASMYINGNKSKIHQNDAKFWQVDTDTRVKKSTVYKCVSKDAEGLQIKFNGVII